MSGSASRWQKIGTGILVLMLSLHGYAQTASSAKIGYVDMKRLLDEAPQMTASRRKLEQEFQPRDTKLKADEEKLATLKQRVTRDSAILSKTDAETLKRETDALERNVKHTREELRNELNTRAAAERDRIWQEIDNSVVEFAREQGYDLIVPSPVVYASGRIDITEQVLERLKRELSAKTRTP